MLNEGLPPSNQNSERVISVLPLAVALSIALFLLLHLLLLLLLL